MPFTITVERPPGFVRFGVAGPASLKNYFDLIDAVARETAPRGDRLALADIRGVAGRLHLSDQLYIGEVVAQKLAHLERMATVVPEDPGTYHSGDAANAQGVALRIFADPHEAVAWLTGRGKPPGA